MTYKYFAEVFGPEMVGANWIKLDRKAPDGTLERLRIPGVWVQISNAQVYGRVTQDFGTLEDLLTEACIFTIYKSWCSICRTM